MRISHGDLQRIFDAAKDMWLERSNPTIDSHLWPAQCTIQAFLDFVAREHGIDVAVEFPKQIYSDPVDE